MVFLPGWIFVTLLKFKFKSWLEKILFSFAISWWLNYFLVFILAILGLYTKEILIILIGFEIFIFFVICRNLYVGLNRYKVRKMSSKYLWILLPVALTVIFYLLNILGLIHKLSIFSTWDAVVSWNRWAVDWNNGIIPQQTMLYPQLIPSNWSIGYVLMGTTIIQFWNKLSMIFFSICTMLIFVLWSIKRKNYIYLLGIPIYHLAITFFYNFNLAIDGYVDIALSFFFFIVFYSVYGRTSMNRLFGLLLASAAAVTKQIGLLFFGIISLISYKEIIKKSSHLYSWLLLGLMTASWYFLKQIQIMRGNDFSNVSNLLQLTKIAQGGNGFFGIISRFWIAAKLLFGTDIKQQLFLIILIISTIIGCFKKQGRLVTALFIIPFYVIWSICFSYDKRNFAVVIPFLVFSALIGLNYILSKIKNSRLKVIVLSIFSFYLTYMVLVTSHSVIYDNLKILSNNLNIGYILVVIILFFLVYYLFVIRKVILYVPIFIFCLFVMVYFIGKYRNTDRVLLSNQIDQQKMLGDSGLNKEIYKYDDTVGIKGKIVTGYQYLCYLPGLEKYCILHPGELSISEARRLGALYILNPDVWMTPEAVIDMDNGVHIGYYKQVLNVNGIRMVELN